MTPKFFLRSAITLALVLVFGFYLARNFETAKKSLSGNFLVKGLNVEREKVRQKAMTITINHYRPDLSQWKGFIESGADLDERFLKDSVNYYSLISQYAPNSAESCHLLAVSYYLSGQKAEALAEQKKAVILEPRYFWAWYNLGLMEYQKGHFAEAATAFKQGLSLRPELTMKVLTSSRMFLEIIRGSGTTGVLTPARTQEGYQTAIQMYNASVNRLKGGPAADFSQISPKIF